MDRRGDEELLKTVGYVAVILVAAGILIYWVSSSASGKIVRDEAAAKQAALLIDAARPGSAMFINQNLTIQGSKVKAGSAEYEFFAKGPVMYKSVQGGTEITVGGGEG